MLALFKRFGTFIKNGQYAKPSFSRELVEAQSNDDRYAAGKQDNLDLEVRDTGIAVVEDTAVVVAEDRVVADAAEYKAAVVADHTVGIQTVASSCQMEAYNTSVAGVGTSCHCFACHVEEVQAVAAFSRSPAAEGSRLHGPRDEVADN